MVLMNPTRWQFERMKWAVSLETEASKMDVIIEISNNAFCNFDLDTHRQVKPLPERGQHDMCLLRQLGIRRATESDEVVKDLNILW